MADCRDIERALERGLGLDEPELSGHVSVCASCRALAQDDGALARALSAAAGSAAALMPAVRSPTADTSAAEISVDMAAAVEQRLERERGPRARLRALPSWARVAAASALGLGLVLVQPLRTPQIGWPRPVALLLLAILLLAGVALVLRPITLPPAGRARGWVAAAALAAPFLVALGVLGHRAGSDAHWGGVATAAACFAYGSLFAAPFFVLLRLLDRSDYVSLPNAVLFGAATGLVAGLVLELHCALTHPLHVSLGHAAVGVLWAAAYAALSSRLMWRASH